MKLVSDQVSELEVSIILRELKKVLLNSVPGDVVELGCYVGTTSLYIQKELQNTKRTFHVYDSFSGLPEKTHQDQSPIGTQFKAGELLATKAQFIKNFKRASLQLPIIHKGWFSELKQTDVPECISFAFLDGDYYSSIIDSLKLIWPQLAPGAVIIIDDYNNPQLPGVAVAVTTWSWNHKFKITVEKSLAIISV